MNESQKLNESSFLDGGYPDTMAKNLENNQTLKCGICMNVLRDPLMCPYCTNNFCTVCIKKWLNGQKKTCPYCRKQIEEAVLISNRGLKDIINQEILISCINKKLGCTWQGKRVEMGLHLQDECSFGEIKCRFQQCGFRGRRKDIGIHEAACPNKTPQCPNCLAYIKPEDAEKHEQLECPMRFVICEKCSLQVQFNVYQKHLDYDCPENLITCPICKEQLKNKDLNAHVTQTTGNTNHFLLLMDYYEQSKKAEADAEKKVEETSKLQDKLQRMEMELNRLSARPQIQVHHPPGAYVPLQGGINEPLIGEPLPRPKVCLALSYSFLALIGSLFGLVIFIDYLVESPNKIVNIYLDIKSYGFNDILFLAYMTFYLLFCTFLTIISTISIFRHRTYHPTLRNTLRCCVLCLSIISFVIGVISFVIFITSKNLVKDWPLISIPNIPSWILAETPLIMAGIFFIDWILLCSNSRVVYNNH